MNYKFVFIILLSIVLSCSSKPSDNNIICALKEKHTSGRSKFVSAEIIEKGSFNESFGGWAVKAKVKYKWCAEAYINPNAFKDEMSERIFYIKKDEFGKWKVVY